jgi:hypothetical protein
MGSTGNRRRAATLTVWGCLWAALATWLWVGAAAPLDGLGRLAAAARSAQGDAIVSSDRGHTHDPLREPQAGAVDASESEEEVGDDGEVDRVGEALGCVDTSAQSRCPASCEQLAVPRDPSTAQRHNRGPPSA